MKENSLIPIKRFCEFNVYRVFVGEEGSAIDEINKAVGHLLASRCCAGHCGRKR